MRLLLLSLLMTLGCQLFSQSVVKAPNQYESTWRLKQIIRNQLNTQSRDYEIKYKDIKGSPFENNSFKIGEIFLDGKSKGNYFLRYDVYADEIQILTGKKEDSNPTYDVLLNIDGLEVIIDGKTFKRHKFIDDSGADQATYFTELVNSENYKLYVKKRVTLTPAVKAASPNESDRAARFNTYTDYYVIKPDGNSFELLPTKKKSFLKFFNEDSKKIKDYLKKEGLKLKNEADLIQIIEFINTLS